MSPRRAAAGRSAQSKVGPATARLSDVDLADRNSIAMWPGRHVEVGGSRLFVRTTPTTSGVAEPAVFLHGLGGASTNWTDLAGLLRDRLAVEAVDLPGFGRSDPSAADDYRVEAQARTVIAYLEQSGRAPVHLAGNSMGGAVSILVAAQRPDLIRTLTLISPAIPDTNPLRAHALRGDPRMALLMMPGIGGLAMRKVAGAGAEVRVRATIALVFADKSRYPEQRMAEAIAEAKDRESLEWANTAFLRSLRGLARSQLVGNRSWAALRSIAVPTLVVWGDRDRLVSPSLAPEVAAAIPDSRLLVLQNVGHTAMMEDPETTARAMLAMLEDVRARA
ncbi:MAG TPA: alpha/beta hydrolase [Jatrophihabitantaceae bacterium]|jgi:pimeloyl-ACP methyl ester carboxylesterase|nr:alpha/beta hydrolase [Jatrophihabitantaceae bacterium]